MEMVREEAASESPRERLFQSLSMLYLLPFTFLRFSYDIARKIFTHTHTPHTSQLQQITASDLLRWNYRMTISMLTSSLALTLKTLVCFLIKVTHEMTKDNERQYLIAT